MDTREINLSPSMKHVKLIIVIYTFSLLNQTLSVIYRRGRRMGIWLHRLGMWLHGLGMGLDYFLGKPEIGNKSISTNKNSIT